MATTKGNEDDKINLTGEDRLFYKVDDYPPWYLTIFFGLQIALTNICYIIFIAMFIGDLICADQEFRSTLFSTSALMCGITSIMQTLLGSRLPVFQGPSGLWILPYLNAKDDPRWKCLSNTELFPNGTASSNTAFDDKPWLAEWSMIHGPLIVANVFEMMLGLTGFVGLMNRAIRPITICVIFTCLGIYVWRFVIDYITPHWITSMVSITIIIIMSQYLSRFRMPYPMWARGRGCSMGWFPLFELFPVLLSVLVAWMFAHILTITGALRHYPNVQTDVYADAIRNASIIKVPYPGQFFPIHFRVEYLALLIPMVFTTMIESIADYAQYSIAAGLPPPPTHAINRGIMMEGLGGIISALFGAGHATTSYSNMMGIISLTRVASRLVYITGAVILIIIACFGKLGMLLVSIPKPALAGPVVIGIALLMGSAFVNLETVPLSSPRNQAILGFSIFIPTMISFYVIDTPDLIQTGSEVADRTIRSVLDLSFLTGGIMAAIMDNTLPGTSVKSVMEQEVPSPKENGDVNLATITEESDDDHATVHISAQIESLSLKVKSNRIRVYDPPFYPNRLRQCAFTRYVPFLPPPDKVEMEIFPHNTGLRRSIDIRRQSVSTMF